MLGLTSAPVLRLQLLQTAGGCLQHASGLLSLLTVEQSPGSSSTGVINGSSPASGRSISTTRGIYMGRVFIRENLVKSATPSMLFTRDNYQYLSQNCWSLAACEQVLANHQAAKRPRRQAAGRAPYDPVNKALTDRIRATTSLEELRQVVEEQAHRMTQINLAVVIQKVPLLLFTPKAGQDFDAAALLLDHAANLLLPKLQYLSGRNICSCLASFVRCRYSPSGELLQQMSHQLLDNGALKLQRSSTAQLAQLMLALSKLLHPQGQWPLQQAVLEQTTARLQALVDGQQRSQQLEGHMQHLEQQAGSAGAAAEAAVADGPNEQQQEQSAPDYVPEARGDDAKMANSIALLAFMLDRGQVSSPEYYAVLHKWLANSASLQGISAIGAVQLWNTVRGQYIKHLRMTAAAAAAAGDTTEPGSSSSSAEPGSQAAGPDSQAGPDAGEAELLAVEGEDAAALPAVTAAGGSAEGLQQQQLRLREFFGPGVLDNLAAATAQLVRDMTERELGQVLASVSAIRYVNPELMAAAAAGFEDMCRVSKPSPATRLSAAWSAALLNFPKPALLQPALLAAATEPATLDGTMVGRLLRLTSWLSPEELQQQQLLLRQELHRRKDLRGPPPTAADADGTAAAGGRNPDWVTAVADDVSKRMAEFKPREIASIVAAFSLIPGVVLHEGLFAAAAQHIETHAHMFTQFKDMELVASAFENMNYTKGLPALKALQQQTEHLAAQSS